MDLFITVATQFRKWAKLISYISQWETGCWVSLWGWIKAGNLLTERERERYLVKKWNTGEMLIKKKIKKKRWREKRCLCKIAVRRVKVNQKGFTPAVCDVSPPKGFQLGPVCSSLFFTIAGISRVEPCQASDKVSVLPADCVLSAGDYWRCDQIANGEAAANTCISLLLQGGIRCPANSNAVCLLLSWLLQFDTD